MRSARSPAPGRSASRASARAASSPPARSTTSRPKGGCRSAWRISRCSSACSTPARPGRRRRWSRARSPRPPPPSPRGPATSTASRSRACSRGCARTTSSGTTWSTTTSWARIRRRSTSCTGTRTRCACPPGCTATSCGSRSRTRSRSPARSTVLGSPVDLRTLDVPTYVVAGKTDHIVPADTAWRSARLLGDDVRFVLSSSGHVQALVNPATPDSRSSYQVTSDLDADRETWQAGAPRHPGSWWTDYTAWLDERSGARHAAPAALGDAAAPGVREGTGHVRARRLNTKSRPGSPGRDFVYGCCGATGPERPRACARRRRSWRRR